MADERDLTEDERDILHRALWKSAKAAGIVDVSADMDRAAMAEEIAQLKAAVAALNAENDALNKALKDRTEADETMVGALILRC